MMFDIDKKITFANMKLLLKPDEVEKKNLRSLECDFINAEVLLASYWLYLIIIEKKHEKSLPLLLLDKK